MHRRVNWALMLATLASAFALYAIKYDTRRLEVRVQAQERALEKAEIDVAVLTAERAHLARPERLEPLARLIGLAPITSTQYLRLDTKGATEPQGDALPADASGR
jgi:cell division protein FtsL